MKPSTLIGILIAVLISLVSYTWVSLAGRVGDNEEDINTLTKAVTKIEAHAEQDQKEQRVQSDLLREMIKRLPAPPQGGTAHEGTEVPR